MGVPTMIWLVILLIGIIRIYRNNDIIGGTVRSGVFAVGWTITYAFIIGIGLGIAAFFSIY